MKLKKKLTKNKEENSSSRKFSEELNLESIENK